jgi:6-pyruvoyltetrahydropterin/6-carboxytetrahydropterin synthase
MFEVEKTYRFEAGHSLVHHDGRCKEPHGHSYILTIHLRRETLISSGPKTNMVMDFDDINKIVKPMIETYFDHRWLNDTLKIDSTTVEFMTKWIYDYLKPQLPDLWCISMNETASARAIYYETK